MLKNYIIVTNYRVILWARGLINSSVDSFEYEDIKSVEQQKGIMFGSIVLNIYGKTEHFYEMNKKQSEKIVSIIRLNIKEIGSKSEKGSKGIDIEEKIRKLNNLYNEGVLTEKEYNEKKKDLLEKF